MAKELSNNNIDQKVKKENIILVLLLLICLFIYTFYRPETILINQFWKMISLYSYWDSMKWKSVNCMPLPAWAIYNLPEALWIFTFTVGVKSVYLPIKGQKMSLMLLPVSFAIILECLQYVHITNGTFDVSDILYALIAWILALLIPLGNYSQKYSILQWNAMSIRFYILFVIVLLAHLTETV